MKVANLTKLLRVENLLLPFSGLLPLPWWWVLPGLLGLLGAGGSGLAAAPALRVLTYPLLAVTLLVLSRGWWLHFQGHATTPWTSRALRLLALSTVLSVSLWSLRFAGLLGPSPF